MGCKAQALKPANVLQGVDRMLGDGASLFSGIVLANVAGAAVPEIRDSGAVYVSANTASSDFARFLAGCLPPGIAGDAWPISPTL